MFDLRAKARTSTRALEVGSREAAHLIAVPLAGIARPTSRSSGQHFEPEWGDAVSFHIQAHFAQQAEHSRINLIERNVKDVR